MKRTVLHAGGIVVRRSDGTPMVLVVTARRNRKRWVLPKGRVKRGEAPAAAAVREAREEAGVTGRCLGLAGVAEYGAKAGHMRVEYYLIAFTRQVDRDEKRERRWCAVEDAIALLTYASARRVLLEAHPAIRRLAKSRGRRTRAPTRGG